MKLDFAGKGFRVQALQPLRPGRSLIKLELRLISAVMRMVVIKSLFSLSVQHSDRVVLLKITLKTQKIRAFSSAGIQLLG
jgi:hypothetical protein